MPPLTTSTTPATAMPPGLLDRLAAKADALDLANTSQSNVFDQFDSPAQTPPAANPFDRFDTPASAATLPPGYTLDKAEASPTPSAASLASSAASKGSATLPPGFTLDAPAGASQGFLDRLGGELGRGILGGVTGVASTAQAGGRLADRATAAVTNSLPWWLGGGAHGAINTALGPVNDLDSRVDNANLATPVANEENRQGMYQPSGAAGKIVEGATAGATGAALTGGASLFGLGSGAAAGGVTQGAQAAGASPTTAGILGMAAGVAVPGAAAARGLAGTAAANAAVARSAPLVSSDTGAASSVLRAAKMLDDAKAATPAATPEQAATTVTQNLQASLTAHVASLQRIGLLDKAGASSLKATIKSAADPNHTGAGLLDNVSALGIPATLAQPLADGVNDLNTVSSGALTGPVAGPLRTLAATAAKFGTPAAAAMAGMHAGSFAPLVEAGAGLLGYAHKPVGQAGALVGGLLDRLAGTRVDPQTALTNAASATLNGASPGVDPLAHLAAVRQQLQTPDGIFTATDGAVGSPGGVPPMNGFRSPSDTAPATSAGTPPPSSGQAAGGRPAGPQSGLGGGLQLPGANLAGTVPNIGGGQAYAQRAFASRFPTANAPTPTELSTAINSMRDDGLVSEGDAAAAHAFGNVHPAMAIHLADRVAVSRGLPSILSAPVSSSAADQATAEVAGLTGQTGPGTGLGSPPGLSGGVPQGSSGITPGATPGGLQSGPAGGLSGAAVAPFGVDASGTPIRNPIAYAGARDAYARHAATMVQLATDPAEKAALSQAATAPRAIDKQAVRDVYSASKPGADLSRFTPALMAGVP